MGGTRQYDPMVPNKKPSASPHPTTKASYVDQKGRTIKPYAGLKILDSKGEDVHKRAQQKVFRGWTKQGSDGTLSPYCKPWWMKNSQSRENPSGELVPPDHIVRRMYDKKLSLLRSYTDEIADDVKDKSTSDIEEFTNDDTYFKSPTTDSPEVQSAKVSKYSRHMEVMQEVRMRGWKAIGFACVAAVSIDTALRIPGLAQRNGGWYFMIAFSLCLLFVVAPMACIEMALGQLTTQHASGIFGMMAPALAGMGVLFDCIRIISASYIRFNHGYQMVLIGIVMSLVHSDGDAVCDKQGLYCYEFDPCPILSNSNKNVSDWYAVMGGHCYRPLTQHMSDNYAMIKNRIITWDAPQPDIERIMFVHGNSLIAVLMFSVVVVILAKNGVLSFYRGSIIFMSISAVCFIIHIITNFVNCDNNCSNLSLQSDAGILWTANVWVKAFVAACSLVGVGDGTMHSIGMYIGFKNNFFKTTSIIIGYGTVQTIFGFLLVLSVNSAVFKDFAVRHLHSWIDPNYIVTVPGYSRNSGAIATLSTTILVIGVIMAQVPYHILSCDILHRRFVQMSPYYAKVNAKLSLRLCSFFYCTLICFVYGVLITLDVDLTMRLLMWNLVGCVVCGEIVIIVWFYGIDRFFVNSKSMLGHYQFYPWLQWSFPFLTVYLKYFLPTVVLFLVASSITSSPTTFFSPTAFAFIACFFIVFAPVVYLLTRHILFSLSITPSLRNSGRWGPSNMENRRRMYHDEKAARMIH